MQSVDVDDGIEVAAGIEEEVVLDADVAVVADHGQVAAAAAAAVAEAFTESHLPVPPPEPELKEPAAVVISAAVAAAAAASEPTPLKKQPRKLKKRVCKFPGCTSTVKAQGHCQRHGAKTKRCKHPGCNSQAQGSHAGYCKRHWRELLAPEEQRKKTPKKQVQEEILTCEPVGSSVYDNVLPASFAWKSEGSAVGSGGLKSLKKEFKLEGGGMAELGNICDVKKDVLKEHQAELIPILQHLVDNESLDPGWHRTNERLARGVCPPKSLSTQLEPWEKQLSVLEMALIAGTETRNLTQHKISKILAHAWGREKGFHKLMIEKHCQRRGDLERKKRVDAGLSMSTEKRAVHKMKYEVNEARKRKKLAATSPEEELYVENAAEDCCLPVPTVPELEPAMPEVVNVEQVDASAVPFSEAHPESMEGPTTEAMDPSIEEVAVNV